MKGKIEADCRNIVSMSPSIRPLEEGGNTEELRISHCCPRPPRKVRRMLACCFPTGIRLHPSRRT
ncbi:MAG: hypothetical protein AAB654_03950, partial [Acidobacteriota bacterium]